MFKSIFSKVFWGTQKIESPQASGIQIFLLQTQRQRHTQEQLNQAMQAAWCREHDPVKFFATIVGDEGGLFKMDESFYPIIYNSNRLQVEEVQDREIPLWADHRATTRLSAEFPGGIPADQLPLFYGLLGLLSAQLISSETCGLFFREAGIFVPATPALIAKLKQPSEYLPTELLDKA